DRAVHRDQLVVELVVDDLLAGEGELRAHDQRHHATDEEPRERGAEIELADLLVVGRADHLGELRAQRGARRGDACARTGVEDGGHYSPPLELDSRPGVRMSWDA